jgi:hypothetical protein
VDLDACRGYSSSAWPNLKPRMAGTPSFSIDVTLMRAPPLVMGLLD